MDKTVRVKLSNFLSIPTTLQDGAGTLAPETSVFLADLYHHYYLDKHGLAPPDPDPANFEYLPHLSSTTDYRYRGGGLGVSPGHRRTTSNEMGQAFCRWFLHDHANITYFAHISDFLNRPLDPRFGSLKLLRSAPKDVPDYVCADDFQRVFIAEAKGTYSSVDFGNSLFQSWRDQFNRIEVRDSSGRLVSFKGFVVATRFATESKPSIRTTVCAEDPNTPGEPPPGASEIGRQIGLRTIALHYARVAEILDQPVLAASLASGFLVPPELQFIGFSWRFVMGPLQGERFIGGYFANNGEPRIVKDGDRFQFGPPNPLQLGSPRPTFFGLHEKAFRAIAEIARRGLDRAADMPRLPAIRFYSAISMLRDGSTISPLEFLIPEGQVTY